MQNRKLTRWWIWLQSRRDGKKNLPRADAAGLGHTESQIWQAMKFAIAEAKKKYLQKIKQLSAEISNLQPKYDRAASEFKRLCAKSGRSAAKVAGLGHYLWMFAIGGSEVCFNAIAFEMLRQPEWQTFVMATGFSTCFMLCSLYIGHVLRQLSADSSRTTKLTMWGAAVGVLAALITANAMRVWYFHQSHPHQYIPAWLFFGLNVVLITTTIALEYNTADPEPGFTKTQKDMDKTAQKLAKKRGLLERWQRERDIAIEGLIQVGLQAIHYFRMYNSRYRSDPAPSYFDDPQHPAHTPVIDAETINASPETKTRKELEHGIYAQKALKGYSGDDD